MSPDQKVEVPCPPPGVVSRRRAESLLPRSGGDGPEVLGTVVCAPAGFGKTTLLSRWARGIERGVGSVAWLTVDKSDDDPATLCADMLAAVARVVTPTWGGGSLPQPRGADTIVGHLVDIVDIVDRQRNPVWLVVDDFDRLGCSEALQILELLVHRVPRRLRLVICTRRYPTGLRRLRIAGLLRDIRADDLAFTPEEAAQLLADHGVQLSDENLGSLMAITEGRPAAVRLAGVALAGSTDHRRTLDGLVKDHSPSELTRPHRLATAWCARNDSRSPRHGGGDGDLSECEHVHPGQVKTCVARSTNVIAAFEQPRCGGTDAEE